VSEKKHSKKFDVKKYEIEMARNRGMIKILSDLTKSFAAKEKEM